jgi:DNA polymerase-1
LETTSGSKKEKSTNPWHNCKVCGIAVKTPDSPAYYVPYKHLFNPIEQIHIRDWLADLLRNTSNWINHNVKYDAHVLDNDFGIYPHCNLVCTMDLAKLIDSDRITRGGYGLDALSKGWLGEDIAKYEQAFALYLKKSMDYGDVPPDIMGEYGGQDVITNEKLYYYINSKMPEQCYGVYDTSIRLQRRLFEMERNGMPIIPLELQTTQLQVLNSMSEVDTELTELVGRPINPASPEQVYDVLVNQYGLPVLAYTKDQKTGEETANPSFDKHALKAYKALPNAPKRVVELIQEFRRDSQFNNLFLTPWQELAKDGLLHPSYNPTVRTGRLSCSDPNAQQLNELAKMLIHPFDGYSILSIDFSQIEFRYIVHYIQDALCIQAFIDNPDIDFHQLLADDIGISRKAAKTINFGIAFGEGVKKLTKQLAVNEDVSATIQRELQDAGISLDQYMVRAMEFATQIIKRYHNRLPTLKPTMRAVESALKMKGYVFNMYGRHRHLPIDKAYRGFNTLNQGSAADMMKERFCALCDMLDGTGIITLANVHDEAVIQGPSEIIEDPRTIRDIVNLMEHPERPISVPIRVAYGVSRKNWKDACKQHKPLQYDPKECTYLEHLKC